MRELNLSASEVVLHRLHALFYKAEGIIVIIYNIKRRQRVICEKRITSSYSYVMMFFIIVYLSKILPLFNLSKEDYLKGEGQIISFVLPCF